MTVVSVKQQLAVPTANNHQQQSTKSASYKMVTTLCLPLLASFHAALQPGPNQLCRPSLTVWLSVWQWLARCSLPLLLVSSLPDVSFQILAIVRGNLHMHWASQECAELKIDMPLTIVPTTAFVLQPKLAHPPFSKDLTKGVVVCDQYKLAAIEVLVEPLYCKNDA